MTKPKRLPCQPVMCSDFVSAQERADEQMSLLIAEHQTSL
ncbi:phosphoglucomutase/phosphomannomutase alpha/beta/subunit [Vibrio cholerae]|nr:phosphoglucomutase/phosphomannomutase alpha/beta/subunit [Vibrio cholerae]